MRSIGLLTLVAVFPVALLAQPQTEADARALASLALHFDRYLFTGEAFPKVALDDPKKAEGIVGPFSIKTTFYDRDFRPVQAAREAGPYAAVVEIAPKQGRPIHRYLTLYRLAEEPKADWKWHDGGAADLARWAGIDKAVVAAQTEQIAATLRDRPFAEVAKDARAGRLLAGLSLSKATTGPVRKNEDAFVQDRQLWVTLRRKLTGLDKEFPHPVKAPLPIKGPDAPVVRVGTMAEAGMKDGTPERLDAIAREWAANDDQAFAVCIVRKGVIVLHKAYGMRDGKPMTVDTKSWMASITKTMSASLMMMLVDEGLVRLDDPVDKFLPALRGIKVDKAITIRHCYTHTAGMNKFPGANDELPDFDQRVADYYPFLEVGKEWAYNGQSYTLAGKVIEAVSGEALPLFYKKHLLDPLGCTGTDVIGTHADAYSIPLDMAKFGQMLLNKGAYGKYRFFREETFNAMLPQKLTDILGPKARSFGIGLDGTPERFGHGAASAASFSVDVAQELVLIMTRNKQGKNQDKYGGKFWEAVKANIVK